MTQPSSKAWRCAVCGYDTADEAKDSITVAIDMHIRGMIEDGEAIPAPVTQGDYVETSAA